MKALQTIPTIEQLSRATESLPGYMTPSTMPSAVVLENHLSVDECEQILSTFKRLPMHGFHGCNAYTRDLPRPLDACLKPIHDAALFVNDAFFNFDVYADEPAAWLQTYHAGNDYQRHTDAGPGQSRKLTAVAMLTDRRDYAGGSLVFDVGQTEIAAPATRGTVLVFPGWVSHRVTPVDHGTRQTINLGLWGPPFK